MLTLILTSSNTRQIPFLSKVSVSYMRLSCLTVQRRMSSLPSEFRNFAVWYVSGVQAQSTVAVTTLIDPSTIKCQPQPAIPWHLSSLGRA